MRTIIFILLFALIAPAQGRQVYVNLSDANGKQIRGDILMKGFERRMQGFTTSLSQKTNTRFPFTMQVCGEAANLKRAIQNGEFLLIGQVTVLQLFK